MQYPRTGHTFLATSITHRHAFSRLSERLLSPTLTFAMQSERLHPFDLPIQRILVDLETRLPPWMKLVTSQSHESAYTRLSNEITAFAHLLCPTSKEKLVRQGIIQRLEAEVMKIWSHGRVVPIGSYAQDLYTSSSDMDLFVELNGVPEGLLNENLEILYQHLDTSNLAAPGTLTIVRGARVPIVKYIDSHGSAFQDLRIGIQVDVSMNNTSATSSTTFVTHHLTHRPLLRSLTMVLKQWLFQRKMNEVYSRGGLSSYALFLLVLTTVHYYPLVATYPAEQILGRYLMEFLRYWSSPVAVMEVIRPLKSPLQKSWPELYQSYGLCILDPVNEENWIGGQTFSIREIQEEWGLSFTALSVAIEEFTGNVNGGREKSLLASIVGLTTREYESRKQINSCQVQAQQTPISTPKPADAAIMQSPNGSGTKLKYPVQEFHPTPAKRTKFRNMLTKDGGLVGDEEVGKIIAKTGNRRDVGFGELLDVTSNTKVKKGEVEMGSETIIVDLLRLDMPQLSSVTTKEITPVSELLDLGKDKSKIPAQEIETNLSSLFDFSHPSPTLTTPSIARTPSTPSLQSISTNLTPFSTPTKLPRIKDQLLISQSPPPPISTLQSLLKFQDEIRELEGGAFRDLASLSGSFESCAVNELSGLDFGDLTASTISLATSAGIRSSNQIYMQMDDSPIANNDISQSPQETSFQGELLGLNFPTTALNLSAITIPPLKEFEDFQITRSPVNSAKSEEGIMFQGRRSRKSSPDIDVAKTSIDPTGAERAFRMFSAEIKRD